MKPQELFIQYEKEVAQFKLALIQRLSGETVPSVPTAKKTYVKPFHDRSSIACRR